ncbi:iron ABC transporter permease [Sphingomonas sp.]|uniref:FecCD family ABC transporter permease n=1 Tax=Sphingomonas sp. TaxID=28214 RepID=UPI0025EBEB90|nr:iron ABC transporter permease [Sphingomonas sp.]
MNRPARLTVLFAVAAAAFALSLVAGKQWLPWDAWTGHDPRWAIVTELRLPRAMLGALLGAALGLSGAVLQGYLRNPLADPTVIGVSSCAAMGAVASIVLGLGGAGAWVGLGQFGWAMAGAIGAMALLSALTARGDATVVFVLAGTVLASLAAALTAFLISIAPNPYAVAEAIDWLMGALTDRGTGDVLLAAPFIVVGAAVLLTTGRALDALALGEDAARSLGIDLARLRWTVVIGTGLAVGAGVAVTGVVGFVGLVVPHLLRPLFGARPSALLVPSAIGGAALVLVADSLCRLAPGAGEVRLGVVMAMIGAPFFLVLLLREGTRSWR